MRALSIELYKMFNRRRSYIGFAAVLVLVVLMMVVFRSEGDELLGFVAQNLTDVFVVQGNLVNGQLFSYLVLKTLIVHLPILIALVTGDLVSGERASGTLRLILTRPISRISLLTSKFLAASLYAICLVGFMGAMSVGLGILFFGSGDLLVLMSTVSIFEPPTATTRIVAAYCFGMLSMCTVASIATMLSTLLRSSVAAILGTIAAVIVLNFVAAFDVPMFEYVRPLLFTTHMNAWQSFFSYDFDIEGLLASSFVLVAYIVGSFLIAFSVFKRKDILS